MTPEVLVLSSLYDISTDLVVLKLEETGVPCLRLNREEFSEQKLSLNPLIPELRISGPGGNHEIGPTLKSVFFRQPVFLRNTPPVPLSPSEQLERSQWMAFLRGLCVFADASWMNAPAATYLAESKPYQLAIAAQCGFDVPETIATNDATRIRNFFPGPCVIKSLDTVLLREGEDCLFTYTTFDAESDLFDPSVQSAPLLAQRLLKSKTDFRITVVGSELFAVRILLSGDGVREDWRTAPREDVEFRPFELGAKLASCCRLLINQLGLSFGAIDLVETPESTFFIEVNPTGEWGWLSGPEQPIASTIARWLARPHLPTP